MTRRIPSCFLLWASVTLAPAAMAQPANPSPPARQAAAQPEPLARSTFIATMDAEYRKLDSNKDGFVTLAELQTQQRALAAASAAQSARQAFAKIDQDRNGQLSEDEFVRASVGQAKVDVAPMMARLDANRDQRVTLVEYRTLTLANFDRLDADKDGIISAAEQRGSGLAK